jgi:hypothetical protein
MPLYLPHVLSGRDHRAHPARAGRARRRDGRRLPVRECRPRYATATSDVDVGVLFSADPPATLAGRAPLTDPDLIAKKLAQVETCIAELRALARLDELARDVKEEWFVEHTLQMAIQAALDVASTSSPTSAWVSRAPTGSYYRGKAR